MVCIYIIFFLILFIILCYFIYTNEIDDINSYNIISRYNNEIKEIRDKQNFIHDSNLPYSMQRAENCNIDYIREINNEITKNYENILKEIKNEIEIGNYGENFNNLDVTQKRLFEDQNGWKNIWIKFFDNTYNHIPTLLKIINKYKDKIILCNISLFWPKIQNINDTDVELIPHTGVSMAVYRYHYGLLIPEGDTGMIINDKHFKWEPKKGVIFDDTLMHSAWNKTNYVRNYTIGRNKIKNTTHVKNIANKIK